MEVLCCPSINKKRNKAMKTRKYAKLLAWLVPVVVAASWQGCSEGTVVDDDSDQPVPLQVGVSLRGEFIGTRSATPMESGEIGVFMPEDKAAGYVPQYNVKYAPNGSGAWQPSDASRQIFLRKGAVKVTAYYDPELLVKFDSENSSVTYNPLSAQHYAATQTDEAKKLLWYIAQVEVSKYSPTARFALKPVYVNVRLILTRDASYVTEPCAINKVSFSVGATKAICRAAYFDVASGTIVNDDTADKNAAYSYDPKIAGITVGVPDSSISDLLLPQDITGGLTIALTIDGTERQITIPATVFGTNNKLESGNQYTISIRITAEQLELTNAVNIADWGDDVDGGSGDIEA